MIQKLAWVFAIVFLAIGVLGFIPGITTADGHLLGVFEVDALHNIVHLITGIIFALVAWKYTAYTTLTFKVFGVVYALVTIVGFVQGNTVLGLFAANMADHILHLIIAAVALYAGFGMKAGGGESHASSMPQSPMGGGGMPNQHGGGGQQGM